MHSRAYQYSFYKLCFLTRNTDLYERAKGLHFLLLNWIPRIAEEPVKALRCTILHHSGFCFSSAKLSGKRNDNSSLRVMEETEKTVTVTVTETEAVKCYCCGLTEECTPRYIDGVKERYQGRWICGLCAEAVKEEVLKLKDVDVSTDEALKRHMKFRSSTSSPPTKPTLDLILAMKQLLFRSLDSPKKEPLTFSPLVASRTCFSPGSSRGATRG